MTKKPLLALGRSDKNGRVLYKLWDTKIHDTVPYIECDMYVELSPSPL